MKTASRGTTATKKRSTTPTEYAVNESPRPNGKPSLSEDELRNHGALASELKGLNAAHASATALANASPNSQVGRIAAYRDTVLAAAEAEQNLTDAQDALAALESQDVRSVEDIQTDIDALDPEAEGYDAQLAPLEEELAAATTYEADLAAAQQKVTDLETEIANSATNENDALLAASNGRELSPEALAYLHQLLDLPPPETATAEPPADGDVATGDGTTGDGTVEGDLAATGETTDPLVDPSTES
ncbi:hypothetical protein B6V75_12300 [Thioclava sp. F1Mire-8]|nr:hypothetical protein B6V75_12300 [Thioclava sp. F1Mire-8]